MFIEPTITRVPLGFSGYIWLDTKLCFKSLACLVFMDAVAVCAVSAPVTAAGADDSSNSRNSSTGGSSSRSSSSSSSSMGAASGGSSSRGQHVGGSSSDGMIRLLVTPTKSAMKFERKPSVPTIPTTWLATKTATIRCNRQTAHRTSMFQLSVCSSLLLPHPLPFPHSLSSETHLRICRRRRRRRNRAERIPYISPCCASPCGAPACHSDDTIYTFVRLKI